MKSTVIFLAAALAVLSASSTPGAAAESKTAAPAATSRSGPERRPSTPTVAVGANELLGSVSQPGWPLVVSALLVPGIDSNGARIVPPRPTLTIRLLDASGAVVPLALQAVGPPVEQDGMTQWYWLAAETATRSLAPGTYRISADAGENEKPSLRISPGTLSLEPAGPGTGADRRLGLLRLQRAQLLGNTADALAETDRLIAADPTDAVAWEARGDLLMVQDLPDKALEAYTRAAGPDLSPKIVPNHLARKRRDAFQRGLEKRGVVPSGR